MSTLYPVSIPPKTLAQPLSSSGSSFVLSDILDWSGTALTTADLGDILYAVFRNTTNTAIEIMKIDTSTIADSAITITARGLRTKGVTDDTEVAANKLDWNANETIVELGSNPPQLYNHFMREGDAESVTGLKTFDKDKLAMKGTSTGVTVISTANASGTDYTATLQAATGTIAYTANITATKLDDFATPDDNTDLNANTTNHGLLLKATAPASGLYNYVGITNGETAYTNKALFDATSPSTQAFGDTAVVGTATVAARRDHKHAMMAAPTRDSLGLDTDDTVTFANLSGTNTGDEPDASTTVKGIVELAIASEVNTGTSTTLAVTPDALAGSVMGTKGFCIIAVAPTTDVSAADGKAYIMIPECMNGMNLVRANASVVTAGTTNATTIDIYNVTDSQDMLSTAISIASAGTVGTAGTVNASYDDVATNDVLRIDVTSASTTNAKGLQVILEFRLE